MLLNDICHVSSVFHFVLFADDTNLFYSYANKDLNMLIELCYLNMIIEPYLNMLIKSYINYLFGFSCNKLSINLKKTHFMIFRPRQKQCNVELDILLKNYKIELVKRD